MSTTVAVKLQDLVSSGRAGKLSDVVEREPELERLVRILMRPNHHHAVLVADPGSGKTSLTEALALRLQQGRYRPLPAAMYRLGTDPIMSLLMNGDNLRACLEALRLASAQLTQAIIVVEDIQLLAADDANRIELTLALLRALAAHPGIRLIVTTTLQAYHRWCRDNYLFARLFEAIELSQPDTAATVRMVEQAVPRLERVGHQTIAPEAIELAVELAGRFGHGRSLPDAAIRLLEDTCTKTELQGGSLVSSGAVSAVVSERERIPLDGLSPDNATDLAGLGPALTAAVVGQPAPLRAITTTLARSRLGLGDSGRPRGSFLLLGPSGVGKTETAKALARHVFHNPAALVRLDMSEYAEPHAAIRLIGSPPGYVGYEEGGQLTGAVMREPYSLVLLDEIEKAHPKVFDLFLQLLDDGRLTDSSGRTADFTNTLVLATSNVGSTEIAAAAASGNDVNSPEFMRSTLLPLLMKTYRPEFINRFDAVLIYRPLTLAHLTELAQRRLRELETRLQPAGVNFDVPDTMLAELLAQNYNPLFGARPVKRLIAGHFETPLAEALVAGQLQTPLTITGHEPWLQASGALS
jgi:ATP-dependent Clp protease ATP-binding subunit ClpC